MCLCCALLDIDNHQNFKTAIISNVLEYFTNDSKLDKHKHVDAKI